MTNSSPNHGRRAKFDLAKSIKEEEVKPEEVSLRPRRKKKKKWMTFVLAIVMFAAGAGMAYAAWTLTKADSAADSIAVVNEDIKNKLENVVPFDDPNAEAADQSAGEITVGIDALVAPSIGLAAPVVHWGASADGNIEVPDSPTVSAFNNSAPLGSVEGSTMITGHVNLPDGTGYSPMSTIVDLKAGDLVVTAGADGVREDWKVTGSKIVDRNGLTPDMWDKSGDRKLVLVTCAGELNSSGTGIVFNENLIVTAVPVAS